MLKEEKLPRELVNGNYEIRKITVLGLCNMSAITLDKKTSIVKHGHGKNEWEVYLDIPHNKAYVCGIGKVHQFINSSEKEKKLLSIKGIMDVEEAELRQFFETLGMEVILAKDSN